MRIRNVVCALFAVCVLCGAGNAEAAADGKIRLGVVGFISKAAGITDAQASVVTDLFTRTLASSQSFSIMERDQIYKIGEEHNFNMSGLVDPSTAAEIGRIQGLQYMMLGSVTELTQGASASGFSVFAQSKHEARATIDARIVDVETAEVLYTFVETGGAVNTSSAVAIGGFTNVETQFGGLEARAIADAVNRLAHNIRSTVGSEYSYVTSQSGKEVKINVGSSLGVQPGTLYLVYEDGATETDLNGRVLGRNKIPIGVVKVDTVQNEFSTCTPVSGIKGNLIQRGDKIDPISASEAKKMADKKLFPQTRPAKRAYDETAAQLFGDGGATQATAPASTPSAAPSVQSGEAAAVSTQPDAGQNAADTPQAARPDIDPNASTEPNLIQTYPISSGEANILGIRHRNAANKYKSGKYKDSYAEYTALTEAYGGDYLAAYWAGMSAQKLRKKDDAAAWLDKALEINPKYQPALEARGKIK